MIKASALLVALAIGLLLAGVLASSLLMVYVSIGVCAIAALILAAGVVSHWSEIFGGGESRTASVPGSWSAPQVQVSTSVLASTQATGTHATGAQAAGAQATGAQAAGAQAAGTAGREHRRSRREGAGGRPPVPPVEVVPSEAEVPVAGRSDDLWERVEEELESPGKRDTGALSWPGTELPVPSGSADRAGPPEQAGPQGGPPPGTKAWIWGSGAGWRPPETPDPSWPPPASAFATPPGRPAATPDEDHADADGAEADRPGPGTYGPASTRSADAGPAAEVYAEPVPEAEVPGPAQDAHETSPDSPDDEGASPGSGDDQPAGPAPEDEAAQADAGPDRPQWILSLPGGESPPADPPSQAGEAETGDPAVTSQDAATAESAPGDLAIGEPAVGEPAVGEPAAGEPSAQESPAQESPAQEPSAEEPEAGGLASETEPGRVEVTVVPGVARYHRSGCILIRFLGASDLEIMTRQEAEEAKFMACRACQPDQLEG